MKIGSVLEKQKIEKRIAITPEIAKKYISLGFDVRLSKDYGTHLGIMDEEYKKLGVNFSSEDKEILNSNVIVQLGLLSDDKSSLLKEDQTLIGVLNPYDNKEKLDELKNLLEKQMFQNFLNYKNVIDFSFSDLLKSNPANKILIVKKELEGNINLMNKAMQSFVELKLEKFSSIVGEMNSLSPLNVLSRGYSISKNKKTDKIIRSKKDINLGDVISTKASEISFESKVTKTD